MQVWSDPRYTAVPERRRRRIFEEFTELLSELEGYEAQQAGSSIADAAARAWESRQPAAATPPHPAVPLQQDKSSAAATDAMAWLEASASFSEDEDEMLAASGGVRLEDAAAGVSPGEESVDEAEAEELQAKAAFDSLESQVLERAAADAQQIMEDAAASEPEDITEALAELEAMYSFTLKIDRKKVAPAGVREPFVLTTYESAEVPAGVIAAAAFAEATEEEVAAFGAAVGLKEDEQRELAEEAAAAMAASDDSQSTAVGEAAVPSEAGATLALRPALADTAQEAELAQSRDSGAEEQPQVPLGDESAGPAASSSEALDVDDLRVQQVTVTPVFLICHLLVVIMQLVLHRTV